MATETHIAGLDILWEGKYHVQRCAWCGAVLQSYDYTRMAFSGPGPHEPSAWPVQALIRCTYDGVVAAFDGVALSRSFKEVVEPELIDGDEGNIRMPEDACCRHIPLEGDA